MFEFIFQLYNFVSAAKAGNDSLFDPEQKLAQTKQSVTSKGYETLGSKRRHETTENSSNPSRHRPSPGAAQDSFGNPSVQEDLMTAGYTLTRLPEELALLTPVSHNLRRYAR